MAKAKEYKFNPPLLNGATRIADTDIPRLKKIIKAHAGYETGFLSKNNPYWLNDSNIKYIEQAADGVIQGCYKNVRVTVQQVKSLENWISGLKSTYL